MCTAIPLHRMISDNKCSIVAEPLKDGLRIYDDPFEVPTNNPPFEYTHYSSCCNADSGIYDYTTCDELEIRAVNMYDADLNQSNL